MALVVTDTDGQEYVFSDNQKPLVKKLLEENKQFERVVQQLQTEITSIQETIREMNEVMSRVVNATISYLDMEM